MRVIVTGATGCVGQAAVRALRAAGHAVHAYVRDAEAAGSLGDLGATLFEGTLADPNPLADAAKGCDVMVHAAGVSSHRASRAALEWTHVAGTENALNAARHAGCRKLVHVSCADVSLCNANRRHWSEDQAAIGAPVDDFVRTKQEAEELVVTSGRPGFSTIALRPALVWGPGDTSFLPAVCAEGLRGGVRLVGRGDNLVATTYAGNLAHAIVLASALGRGDGGAYHIVDEELTLARDFFAELCRAVGLPPPRRGAAYPVAYAAASVRQRRRAKGAWRADVIRRGRTSAFDASRARTTLGYRAPIDLATGMAALARWAAQVGGAEAIANMARPAASDADVAEQLAYAGAEGEGRARRHD
ncbi:MAG: NAD-dependent epimerase/dehydratase family protein [Myxococcales bacterium]|nr:NAD-dependent epimerase/dehydratase family protein [Myxococcales bacterium]